MTRDALSVGGLPNGSSYQAEVEDLPERANAHVERKRLRFPSASASTETPVSVMKPRKNSERRRDPGARGDVSLESLWRHYLERCHICPVELFLFSILYIETNRLKWPNVDIVCVFWLRIGLPLCSSRSSDHCRQSGEPSLSRRRECGAVQPRRCPR